MMCIDHGAARRTHTAKIQDGTALRPCWQAIGRGETYNVTQKKGEYLHPALLLRWVYAEWLGFYSPQKTPE